jgi:protein subunit release factor B
VPLVIAPDLVIPDEEFEWKAIRSSGPGGQNVNKVASAVQLRFLLPANTNLPAASSSQPAVNAARSRTAGMPWIGSRN